MGWTIKGETGATLDATERTPAALILDSCDLTLASVAADQLVWTAAAENATGAGVIVPDAGQLVEAYYNGTRRFRGHVTIPRISNNKLVITCEGPWWWMNKIPLKSSQADETGTTGTRPSYVFPTQSLKTSFEALIDAMIADGVPIVRGTVDTMFDFPRITLSERTYAQALADLLAIVPDATAWIDYTVATLPALHISRRSNMVAVTHTIGTDAIEAHDLYPRLDLEVAQVSIASATRRATDGKTQWATQTSGTAVAGKNQLVVISGPEPADFLPPDRYDSVAIKTIALPTNGTAIGTLTTSSSHSASSITGALKDFVFANDETIATMIREWSTFDDYAFLSNGGRFLVSLYVSGSLNGAPGFFFDRPNLISKSSTSGMYIVISPDRIPDWASWENGYPVTDATLTGFVRWTGSSADPPDWWDEGVRRAQWVQVGYPANTGSNDPTVYQRNLAFEFAIPVQLIGTAFANLTTIYRAWDYDYVAPPAGLAAALVGAQNWVPWEGYLTTVADAADGATLLGNKHNVANALTPCATMGALAKSVSFDLMRGRRTVRFGAPARTSFSSLASRFRRSPKDNIVYI